MTDIKILKEQTASISVLFVDDDPGIRTMMETYLTKFFHDIEMASNGLEALMRVRERKFDLIITDILMPQMDGLKLIQEVRALYPHQEFIISSAYSDADYLIQAIELGVTSYMQKPVQYERIINALEHAVNNIVMRRENSAYKTHLESMLEEKIQAHLALEQEKIENYEQTLLSLVNMIEARDTYTAGHSQRVADYAKRLGEAMGLERAVCDLLYRAGIIHDIGKIATPDAILLKPGKLSNLEYNLIKEHAKVGFDVLHTIPMYAELSEAVKYHHEHYDGTGYPSGAKGEAIPLLARILTVADSFDAMTTSRIYKGRLSVPEALNELERHAGTQFDPHVVQAARKALAHLTVDHAHSQQPATQIEQERFVYFYKDPVTDTFNKSYLETVLSNAQLKQTFTHATIVYLHHFSAFNTLHGWNEGDRFLKEWAAWLRTAIPQETALFRVYGDDFIALHHTPHLLPGEKFLHLPLLVNNGLQASSIEVDLRDHAIRTLDDLEQLLPSIKPA